MGCDLENFEPNETAVGSRIVTWDRYYPGLEMSDLLEVLDAATVGSLHFRSQDFPFLHYEL